jgi:hypothetical protein
MVTGGLEPRDVARLLATLEQGMAEGRMRPLAACPPVTAAAPPFMPLPGTGPRNGLIIAGRVWQRKALLAQAQRAVAQGHIVTVICLAPTARAHRHSFTASGVWLQQGGLFGRADRREPLLRLTTFAARVARECRRLSPLRPLSRLPHL